MSTDASKVYLLSITILPQREGVNVRDLIRRIADELYRQHHHVNIVHKFKVTGEAKVIAIAVASIVNELDGIVENLYSIGPLSVECQPLIQYEKFARNLGVDEELLKPGAKLSSGGLYWLEFEVDYCGKTMEELLDIWKREAEAVLTPRSKGESVLEAYKSLAQRGVHVFLNQLVPEQLDSLTFNIPLMRENGDNVHIQCKGLQILNEHNAVYN